MASVFELQIMLLEEETFHAFKKARNSLVIIYSCENPHDAHVLRIMCTLSLKRIKGCISTRKSASHKENSGHINVISRYV